MTPSITTAPLSFLPVGGQEHSHSIDKRISTASNYQLVAAPQTADEYSTFEGNNETGTNSQQSQLGYHITTDLLFSWGGLYRGAIDCRTGLPDGLGTMKFDSLGREYSGEWSQGRLHGFGTLRNRLGDLYEGNFVGNQKHGFGTDQLADGRMYAGKYSHNRIRRGKLMDATSNCYYKGTFEGVNRCGFGVQVYGNGTTYAGEWQGDKRHGHGVLEQTDGTCLDGEWAQDLFSRRNSESPFCLEEDPDDDSISMTSITNATTNTSRPSLRFQSIRLSQQPTILEDKAEEVSSWI